MTTEFDADYLDVHHEPQDFGRFVAMMEEAGWVYHPNTPNVFRHTRTSAEYNAATGKWRLSAGSPSWIGDWRQWIEEGRTPPVVLDCPNEQEIRS